VVLTSFASLLELRAESTARVAPSASPGASGNGGTPPRR